MHLRHRSQQQTDTFYKNRKTIYRKGFTRRPDKFYTLQELVCEVFLSFSSHSTTLEIAQFIRESGDVLVIFGFQSAYKLWQGKRARTNSLYFTEPHGNQTECNPFCLLLRFPSTPCVLSASRWRSRLYLELSTCDRITQNCMVTPGLYSSPSLVAQARSRKELRRNNIYIHSVC